MKENNRSKFMGSASQELISKVIFFSVALTFTFLGYSLQFGGTHDSRLGFILLISSWVSLLLSGLLGLWAAHKFASFTMESKSLWDLKSDYDEEKAKETPDQSLLKSMEDKSSMQRESGLANMKGYHRNRVAHLVLMVAGLTSFGISKTIEIYPSSNSLSIGNTVGELPIKTTDVVGLIKINQQDCLEYRAILVMREANAKLTAEDGVLRPVNQARFDDETMNHVCFSN